MFTGKRVLTIDDADTIRAYLKTVLAPLGAEVDGAATGEEGLQKCIRDHYDLILIDLILPDADGMTILQRVREKNQTSTIVVLTGHGGIKSAIAAVQLGADGYLEKQDMTATARDHSEFLYSLDQAFDHRAGLIARQELEAMRADFYSIITHDLRNPAGAVDSALEMLEEDAADSLTTSQRQFIGIARIAVHKMLALINDYLDYAKIDAGYLRLECAQVELRQLVEDSARLSTLQAQHRGQTLTLDLPDEPLLAFADGERLNRVLDNLLSNAVKYTPEGGSIQVQLRQEGDQAVFRVTDSGVGISPEEIPALFAKYHRLPGEENHNIRGTGLGLLIVKEIVEAHGGSIQAESQGVRGKGATFSVTIPLEAAPLTQRPSPPEADDDAYYQVFVQESLGQIRTLQSVFGQLNDTPDDPRLIEMAQHATHTLKGNAGAMQFTAIRDLASQMDEMLRQARAGDLALTRNRVTDLTRLLSQIDMALART